MDFPVSSFIPGISLIRIILCLMICSFHWAGWSSVGGGVGVDWFIVLSGFLMMFSFKENQFNLLSFYISKFARLWPLLFTAFLVSALLAYKIQFNFSNLAGVFIASLGGNQFVHQYTGNNYPLWYMKLEILFVLFFPFAAWGRKKVSLLLALCMLMALACQLLDSNKILYSFFPYRLWQFLAGCYAAQIYKKHGIPSKWAPIAFLFGIFYLLYQMFKGTSWGCGGNVSNFLFLLIDTFIAVITISGACSLRLTERKTSKFLSYWVNQASLFTYALFLFHIPILHLMQSIWPHQEHGKEIPFLFWVASCLVLFAAGVTAHYCIEQPCSKWLRFHLQYLGSKLGKFKKHPH